MTSAPDTCFVVTTVARDVGPVDRLHVLPDGRLLALLETGEMLFAPAGAPERPPLGRSGQQIPVVVDFAVDPDFRDNGFVFLAAVGVHPAGDRTVSLFRARELAGSLGEVAAIVADLPTSSEGRPAISVGPDDDIYVAMPSDEISSRTRPYDGQVLRFTREGRAAGHVPSGSPILARGIGRPASLVWDGSGHLLLGSSASGIPVVRLPVDVAASEWPAEPRALRDLAAGALRDGIRQLAVSVAAERSSGYGLLMIGARPASLYITALAPIDRSEAAPLRSLPLGALIPVAVADGGGGLVVAARVGSDGPVDILTLRPVKSPR